MVGIAGEGLGFAIGYGRHRGLPGASTSALDGGQVSLLLLGTLAGTALSGCDRGRTRRYRPKSGRRHRSSGSWPGALVVENLLFAFVPGVGRLAPVHAQDALMGLTTNHLLHATAGGLVLIAWTAVLAVVGVALAARRDVN